MVIMETRCSSRRQRVGADILPKDASTSTLAASSSNCSTCLICIRGVGAGLSGASAREDAPDIALWISSVSVVSSEAMNLSFRTVKDKPLGSGLLSHQGAAYGYRSIPTSQTGLYHTVGRKSIVLIVGALHVCFPLPVDPDVGQLGDHALQPVHPAQFIQDLLKGHGFFPGVAVNCLVQF